MLLLIPITIVLVLFLAYSWMNINNDNVEEKRESGRDPEELAPAWLLIILHGLSELHDKLQLEVGEIVKISPGQNIKDINDIKNILQRPQIF